ncbi:MAG: DUF2760 domain-containing protein [Methylotetracoccus sp.]|nr:DUF2760 domain-containing protein [Methylotetracoccus sp.]
MQIDLTFVPDTLDAVHVALASAIFLLILVQILLLTFVVIGLVRQGRKPDAAAMPTAVETRPAALVAEPPTRDVVMRPDVKAQAELSRLKDASPDSALQLLGLLQNEARFVDFVEENVTAYSDAEIGAAARVVHEGCRKVIRQHFELEPVRNEAESSRITVPKGFDAAALRLTGNIVGQPPFSGTLVHRGWRVSKVKLPKMAEGHDPKVIATAEVEL